MRERLCHYSITVADPDETGAVSTLEAYVQFPFNFTIVGVSVAPRDDDAGATMDIDDDGTNVISAIGCADADAPGTWISTEFGGTETPVHVAADSKVALDFNNAAAANAFFVNIWYLAGSVN